MLVHAVGVVTDKSLEVTRSPLHLVSSLWMLSSGYPQSVTYSPVEHIELCSDPIPVAELIDSNVAVSPRAKMN